MPAEQLVQFWLGHYEEQSKMHTHTEFGIPNSKSVGDMLRHNYSRNVVRGQGQQ